MHHSYLFYSTNFLFASPMSFFLILIFQNRKKINSQSHGVRNEDHHEKGLSFDRHFIFNFIYNLNSELIKCKHMGKKYQLHYWYNVN
jgi:hypothetical protein